MSLARVMVRSAMKASAPRRAAPAATSVLAATVRAATVRAATVRAATVLAATVRAAAVLAAAVRAAAVLTVTVLAVTVLAVTVAWSALGPSAPALAASAGSATGARPAMLPVPPGPGGGIPVTGAGPVRAASAPQRGIILPNLLVVVPGGLTRGQLADMRAISGVRAVNAFDGARITVNGHPASVIGVSPASFRSWVPPRVAADQRLWRGLAAGGLVATDAAARRLGLTAHRRYLVIGRTAMTLSFTGQARLAIAGVDALVNGSVSARLGLVHRVAALISAPGTAMRVLTARVRAILGRSARLVTLGGGLPVPGAGSGPITSYLQLFRDSAARYCPRLSWTVLAAIGQIESGDGRNVGPSSAGALGPMQFMPGTWAQWGIDGFGPPGPPDVLDPLDAVPSAARMLCADGASAGTPAGLRQAIFAYNHATWYVNEVLALAAQYAARYH
jgi:hypothetical protein